MSDNYDRDLNPIDSYSTNATKWAGKRVLKSVDRGFKLSTVWLSLDHQYGNGSPIVFETLIWDKDEEEVGGMRHYSEEAAARWHLKALDAIRAGAVPDYLNDDWMSAAPTSPDYTDGGVTAAFVEAEVAGSDTRTDEEDWQARAEKATAQLHDALDEQAKLIKERGEARLHECSDLDAHWRLDETLASLKEANATVASLRAAQPRTLTPDDIKSLVHEREQQITRKIREAHDRDPRPSSLRIAAAVYQGLTEPTRPEGAEEIEAMIRRHRTSHPGDEWDKLADHLASEGLLPPLTDKTNPERGVRVVT